MAQNQDLSARRYNRQFIDYLQTVYNKQSYFGDFSANGVQTLDGIQYNATAFSLKTSNIPVVLGTYNTAATVAFGTGTANSSRFGQLTEIIYQDTDVPYTGTWSVHEGLDRYTVNNDLAAAVADRLLLQTQAQVRRYDTAMSTALSAAATALTTLPAYTDANIAALFNDITSRYVNLEVDLSSVVFKVGAELYNAIVNHPLTVTNKNSSIDIDGNQILVFKGIRVMPVPASSLPSGVVGLVYPTGIGAFFVGVNTVRTLEAIDFDGQVLQGAGRYGSYILPDNTRSIFSVATPTPGP